MAKSEEPMLDELRTRAPRGARNGWVDVARGLGIILVVFGHALRALFPDAASEVHDVPYTYPQATDHVIYSFHMPLFFMLSGLFVWRSLSAGKSRFLRAKLLTLAYPYFLWSIIEGGLEVALSARVNSPVTPHDLLMIPFVPIEQFWFLYALFLCQLIVMICYPSRTALALSTVGGVGVVWLVGSGPIPLRALYFLPFVVAGMIAAKPFLRIAGRARTVMAVGLPGAILWVATLWGTTLTAQLLAGVAGSIALIAIAMLVALSRASGPLELLGRASMAIYVMHPIFSAGSRVALKLLGMPQEPATWLVATTLVGLAGPLAVWWVAARLNWSVALGFGRAPG